MYMYMYSFIYYKKIQEEEFLMIPRKRFERLVTIDYYQFKGETEKIDIELERLEKKFKNFSGIITTNKNIASIRIFNKNIDLYCVLYLKSYEISKVILIMISENR